MYPVSRTVLNSAALALLVAGIALQPLFPQEAPSTQPAMAGQSPPPATSSQRPMPLPMAKGDAEAIDEATKLYKADVAWMQNKLSTPGTSADVREVSRTRENGKLVVRYHVFVKGASADQTYRYMNWPINQSAPTTVLQGLSIARDGVVVCAGRAPEQCSGDKPDDPVEVAFMPAKAELYRVALVSADDAIKVLFAVVPDPIMASDKRCSLEVVRLMPKFELTMLRGKGFQPNEDVEFYGESYGEVHTGKSKADGDGQYSMALLPAVKGKDSGKMNVRLKAASCTPALAFEWGK